MTIDEVIYCMQSYLPSDDNYTHCTKCKYYGCKDNNTCASSEAHQKAIDTMRKYQKIEEIVGNYGFDTSWQCLKKIREVIEDGKA